MTTSLGRCRRVAAVKSSDLEEDWTSWSEDWSDDWEDDWLAASRPHR